jgi:hypothetical protein
MTAAGRDDTTVITFHCRRCQWPLGEVVGPDTLRVGGVEFPVGRRLDVLCPRCKYVARWFPEPKPVCRKKGLTNVDAGTHNDS